METTYQFAMIREDKAFGPAAVEDKEFVDGLEDEDVAQDELTERTTRSQRIAVP